jgi:Ni/Fe-hydrogenase subunit HybB-like protein
MAAHATKALRGEARMEDWLVLAYGFALSLVWVAFLSWVVGHFAYRELEPGRRAAYTASTSFVIAALISIAFQVARMNSETMVALGLGSFDFSPFAFYAAAAFVDFLLLQRYFKSRWASEEETADTFS